MKKSLAALLIFLAFTGGEVAQITNRPRVAPTATTTTKV